MATTAGTAVLSLVGISIWLVVRPKQSDCSIVDGMLSYSKSENDRMRQLIPVSTDDPQKLVDAFQTRENRMHGYADSIRDAGLRQKANALVNLDDQILYVWRKTIPGEPPSKTEQGSATPSQDLRSAYAEYSPKRQKAAEALQAACPVS